MPGVFLTTAEFAERWKITPEVARKYVREKRVPSFRPPGSRRRLIPLADLLDIERKETGLGIVYGNPKPKGKTR